MPSEKREQAFRDLETVENAYFDGNPADLDAAGDALKRLRAYLETETHA